MYILIIIILLLSVLTYFVWASSAIKSKVYLDALCEVKTDEKKVALTFDDGPSEMTGKVLDVLSEYGVKATFFVIGSQIKPYESTIRRMVKDGHNIGIHTWSHSSFFPLSSYNYVSQEIGRTSAEIQEFTGKKPRLFRPPFGVTNPIIGYVVKDMSLTTIGWNVRSFDTNQSVPRNKILERILKRTRPGSVILLHDRCKDADVLVRNLIESLRTEKYKFVTVEELFNIKGYYD